MTSVKDKASETVRKARAKAETTLADSKTKASEAARVAREKTDEAVRAARTKAGEAAKAARDGARSAAARTEQGIDANPIVAVLGGLVMGAIAGALLPTSRSEAKVMGNTSRKVRETASAAMKSATQTGKEQLDALGLNADTARDQLRGIAKKLGEAASSAGSAAADSVRRK